MAIKPRMTLKLKTSTPRMAVVKPTPSPRMKLAPAAPILKKSKRKFG